MDKGSEDRTRLLASSIASDEDLEAFPKADSNRSASYMLPAGSYHSSPRSSMTEYKRLPQYNSRSPMRRTIRKSCCTLRHACSVLALLTVFLVAFCLGATFSPRESVFVTTWLRKPPPLTKPRVVGLIFCQYQSADMTYL